MYDQLNAVGVQVCMGINNFASYYYQGNNHTAAEDEIFSAAIGRMRYMVTGSELRANVAVYYPYEGVSAETLPSTDMWKPTAGAKQISDAFSDLCKTLVEKQVDYDLLDWKNLSACRVENGALVTPSGERFSAIAVPYTTALRSETVLKLIEAAEAGVAVILEDFDSVVCERGKGEIAARFSELVDCAQVVKASVAAANRLREIGCDSLRLDDAYASSIYISKRSGDRYALYTVVNAYTEAKTYTFTAFGETAAYNITMP